MSGELRLPGRVLREVAAEEVDGRPPGKIFFQHNTNIPKSFSTTKNIINSFPACKIFTKNTKKFSNLFSNTIIWTMDKILKMFNRPATLVKNYKQKRVDKRVDKGDMKGNLEKLNIFRN